MAITRRMAASLGIQPVVPPPTLPRDRKPRPKKAPAKKSTAATKKPKPPSKKKVARRTRSQSPSLKKSVILPNKCVIKNANRKSIQNPGAAAQAHTPIPTSTQPVPVINKRCSSRLAKKNFAKQNGVGQCQPAAPVQARQPVNPKPSAKATRPKKAEMSQISKKGKTTAKKGKALKRLEHNAVQVAGRSGSSTKKMQMALAKPDLNLGRTQPQSYLSRVTARFYTESTDTFIRGSTGNRMNYFDFRRIVRNYFGMGPSHMNIGTDVPTFDSLEINSSISSVAANCKPGPSRAIAPAPDFGISKNEGYKIIKIPSGQEFWSYERVPIDSSPTEGRQGVSTGEAQGQKPNVSLSVEMAGVSRSIPTGSFDVSLPVNLVATPIPSTSISQLSQPAAGTFGMLLDAYIARNISTITCLSPLSDDGYHVSQDYMQNSILPCLMDSSEGEQRKNH